jgi:pimeloyl-ACP methyl ester carboxylesterase
VRWYELDRGGVRLACCDYGGAGPVVLCLHGLAGHSGEWERTAAGLAPEHRVVALDQRGHGLSERQPTDVTREAYVADAAYVIEQLDLGPTVAVGQSMGANTAFLLAASRPELVSALVVAEASPEGPSPELAPRIREWLGRWPVPFSTDAAAREFFLSQGLAADAWVAGLQRRDGGLWPAFDPEVMVGCIADLGAHDYLKQWRSIRCPTLIVRGDGGNFFAEHVEVLAQQLADARSVTIARAGHDVHLERPGEWLGALQGFLRR